jgi:hypothetical protein
MRCSLQVVRARSHFRAPDRRQQGGGTPSDQGELTKKLPFFIAALFLFGAALAAINFST